MLPFTDIVALILGIFLTTRKLDIAKREVQDFGHLTPEAFEDWKEQELNVYRLASSACFAKVVVGFALYILVRLISYNTVRVIDLFAHLGWVAALIVAGVLAHKAKKTRQRLGIVLVAPAPTDSKN